MRLPRISIKIRADAPSPGNPGTLSGGGGRYLGSIPLVPSMGRAREATYRAIYLTNPWVYAAVNKISRSIGRLPIHVYELDQDGGKTRIRGDVPLTPGRTTGGQALDRMLSMPSGGISRNAMFATTMQDRLVYGNGLWEIERGFMPTGLKRVAWQDVWRVIEDSDGNAIGYEVKQRNGYGKNYTLLAADVVHFGLGSDGACSVGVSPLQSCSNTLALFDALIRHLIAYFGNSMRPSGVLEVDKLTPEKATLIRTMIEELYASPENAGKVLVTTGNFKTVTDSLDQAQIIELIKASREEIAAAYEIPPPVIGILDQAIKSNVKELREQFGRDTIGPWASDVQAELMAQLLPQTPAWSSLFVEFQLAALLWPDMEARALVYQRMGNVYTIDEIRGFENMPPLNLPGVSDVPWAPSGYMPLPTAAKGKQPAAKLPPQAA